MNIPTRKDFFLNSMRSYEVPGCLYGSKIWTVDERNKGRFDSGEIQIVKIKKNK